MQDWQLPALWAIGALAAPFFFASPAMGLLLGIACALALGNGARGFTGKAGKYLLQGAVILLGFGLRLDVVLRVGYSSIGITFISISLTMLVGWALGRLLAVDPKVTTLIGSGTAICGGSAIAAIAPTIGATPAQTAIALAVVFILNAAGLLIFPGIGHALGMTEQAFGLWAALAIHDTSSVVGAATLYGTTALAIATTVKLTRALWILPLSFASARLHRSASKTTIQWFLFGFLAAATARAWLPDGAWLFDLFAFGGKRLMVSTLFLIGAGLTVKDLRTLGVRPLIMAITLWLIVSLTSFAMIRFGWLTIMGGAA
ncbi:MAG: putative sulfate exporter family transporter [Syntrophales bacterium]|nr:putative sulfate exporter family transporter [Syntrophales bacterium]